MNYYSNPILPGFYPDPSICRVEDDYYIVNSTFAYFPGVPIFHSKDLVNWRQIGNVFERPSQLELGNCEHSAGVFAPTLRYHNGIFYMITTLIGGIGNCYVTATNPAGPWSDPIRLDAPGIDPSLFFDEDGKVYYVGTMEKGKDESKYYGDNIVWLQELDIISGKLVGERFKLWEGALIDCVWPEGPHLYKKGDYYYLMIAEGGTGHNHAITIARSRCITGPYENNPCNPIVTHRHLGRNYPITNVGHGDLVQIQDGGWWMVLLASRPYNNGEQGEERYANLGRETFLVPVEWENDWPVVNVGKGLVEEIHLAPKLKQLDNIIPQACEHFDEEELGHEWMTLRTPHTPFYSLKERKGYLRLMLKPEQLSDKANPSFLAVRQKHMNFIASCMMEFKPGQENEVSGLVIVQSNKYHYRLEYAMEAPGSVIRLIRCEGGREEIIASSDYIREKVYMKIVARRQRLSFYYGDKLSSLNCLINNVDASILSTERAGGFVGNTIGLYASSRGIESTNYADFDWFEYMGI